MWRQFGSLRGLDHCPRRPLEVWKMAFGGAGKGDRDELWSILNISTIHSIRSPSQSIHPMDSNNESFWRTASHANAAQQFNEGDIIMAVMGVTGAGKSTLISKLIGDDSGAVPVVGHGLQSETKLTDVYQFHHKVHGTIHLIDTPGFDDTHASDAEVLREIASFLSSTYQTKVKLSGIIYLHRISDNRISGSALRNLRMFKELCGEDAYKHVVLATSMWGKEDHEKALGRERELVAEGGFWSTMKERGSSVMRWLGDSVSAHEIIEHLLLARSRHGVVSLKIQRELVDEGKRLVNTSAGQEVNRELSELREKMENELRRIQEENKEAMASKDIEWQQSLVEQRLLLEKQRLMAEQSQEALKVDFHRLLAETDEKYRIEMSRILEELKRAEEEMHLAHKLGEEKDQAVKALEAQMSGAGTAQEQAELREKIMRELADMEAARTKEEHLREEIETKTDRWNKIVLWMKKVGELVVPILGAVVASSISGAVSGAIQSL
ncbi:hypothetical protein J7T55_009950 [Diaporthe amygdali]|uniref:uncharacterized protein n=1 Tax=Phomopsis amygdali TaxID=1214568 RepID=UPI0022FE9975|nr:uncharacterized protein J7T55_009950 [Diaporthe amygdali]KAJ0116799.1 hypothetical protein J7T55_009950 [Diaporthe amygdali]